MPVTAPAAGTYLMKVAYIDGDSSRQAVISVNGAGQWINTHGSGDNDWGKPARRRW